MLVSQRCPAPSDPVDCSPLGSSVHGIFQARILEWVAFSPSGDLSDPGIKPGSPALQGDSLPPESRAKPLNDVIAAYSDTSSSWSVAHQAPLSVEFSRQEYWSGSSFPAPGNLPHPGIEPRSPTWQADALTSEPPGKPRQVSLEIKSGIL